MISAPSSGLLTATKAIQRILKRTVWGTLLCVVVLTSLSPTATASTISQGYTAKDALTPGTLVSLDQSTQLGVQAANVDNLEGLLGVVVSSQDALITLTSDGKQVQVATGGVAQALVSDLQGEVKKGDKITTSPIGGVGMKADTSGKILGVAQSDFNTKDPGTIKRQIKDKSGATHDVQIGRIEVLVDVAYYVQGAGDDKSPLPKFIQDLTTMVAGKKVSTVRIITSLLILILGLASSTILLYSSAKSSIISIGRNPLSQKAVYRGLIQVFVIVVVILVVTIGAVYLIITR